MTDIATAMQHRADLIEQLIRMGTRPVLTANLSTAQLEQLLAYEQSRESHTD
jgi:hypothetical protein